MKSDSHFNLLGWRLIGNNIPPPTPTQQNGLRASLASACALLTWLMDDNGSFIDTLIYYLNNKIARYQVFYFFANSEFHTLDKPKIIL